VRGRPLRPWLLAALAWGIVVTAARTARLPNDFATAHWLLDYRFGLIKRGLAGAVMSTGAAAAGAEPTQGMIDTVGVALLVVSTAVLLGLAVRLVARDRSRRGALVALAVVCSPVVVMNAHLTGYFDGLLLTLAVAAVALVRRSRPWAAGAVVAVAVLVHELSLVLVAPVVLLAAWRRGVARHPAWLLPLAVAATVAVNQQLLDRGRLREALQEHLATFPFLGNDMATLMPLWMTDSFIENLRQCAEGLLGRVVVAIPPLHVAPLTVALLALAWPRIGSRAGRMATVAVCALPQVVQLFAWDTSRFWTHSLLVALVATWAVIETGDEGTAPSGRSATVTVAAAVVALTAGIATTVPLMDGLADRLVPAVRLLAYTPVVAATVLLVARRSRDGARA
jgi:hypothetical protein